MRARVSKEYVDRIGKRLNEATKLNIQLIGMLSLTTSGLKSRGKWETLMADAEKLLKEALEEI